MKYILSLFAMLVAFSSNAQMNPTSGSNEKFIEVKVTDTIMVNPDVINFVIALESEEDENYFDDDESEDAREEDSRKKKNDAIQKKKLIEEVLNKNKLAFKFHEKKEGKGMFDITKEINMYENAYEVTLSSDAQLEKIKKELSTIKDITTKVVSTKLNDQEKHELILIDKVMKKAEREAGTIAKSMNVTLDKPLNVSNQSVNDVYSSMFNNPESMGGMGALFSMMGNMFKSATQPNTQVAVSKTLVVRFSIK